MRFLRLFVNCTKINNRELSDFKDFFFKNQNSREGTKFVAENKEVLLSRKMFSPKKLQVEEYIHDCSSSS